MILRRWGRKDGVMAGGVEAEDDFGARGTFDSEALRTNGNATIGSDLEGGA